MERDGEMSYVSYNFQPHLSLRPDPGHIFFCFCLHVNIHALTSNHYARHQLLFQTSPHDHGVRVNCLCPSGVYTDMVASLINAAFEGKYNPPRERADNLPKTQGEAHEAAREEHMK